MNGGALLARPFKMVGKARGPVVGLSDSSTLVVDVRYTVDVRSGATHLCQFVELPDHGRAPKLLAPPRSV